MQDEPDVEDEEFEDEDGRLGCNTPTKRQRRNPFEQVPESEEVTNWKASLPSTPDFSKEYVPFSEYVFFRFLLVAALFWSNTSFFLLFYPRIVSTCRRPFPPLTRKGEPCKNCRKTGRLCHLHLV